MSLGEVDLETLETSTEPPPAEPAAVAEPEPAAEPEPVVETEPEVAAAAPAPEPAPKKHTGAVAELIENRRLLKETKERLARYEQDPALQRITPEMRQAILEGRVQVAPPQQTADLERSRLEAVAKQLGLLKPDNTPDLDAASRVDQFVRGAVRAEVAPIEHRSLATVAEKNVEAAVAYATAQKYTPETIAEIRSAFQAVLGQPNGPKLLSDAKLAEEFWHSTVGRLVSQGKFNKQAAKEDAPPVVVTEPAGRRAPSTAAPALSPALQAVYKSRGLDPGTGAAPVVDARGHMSLED
jgi:hypothetical protein